MLNQSDIEAMAPEIEVFDRVIERVKRGVPAGREIMANEILPFIRVAVLMRDVAEQSARYMAAQYAREIESMSLGPTER